MITHSPVESMAPMEEATPHPSFSTSHASSSDPAMESRPFACPERHCVQRFKRKFTLTEHLKTHTGEKPFACPVGTCGKSFTTSGNRARHMRLHPWLPNLTCFVDNCGRAFTSETKLDKHRRSHHDGSNGSEQRVTYPCKMSGCSKQFSTPGNLTRHLKQTHLEKEESEEEEDEEGDCYKQRQAVGSSNTGAARSSNTATPSFVSVDESMEFNPLINEPSNVNDDELLETLRWLFD